MSISRPKWGSLKKSVSNRWQPRPYKKRLKPIGACDESLRPSALIGSGSLAEDRPRRRNCPHLSRRARHQGGRLLDGEQGANEHRITLATDER
jgi:hypothetical protein